MNRLKGSCLCKAVEYTVEARFLYAAHCHCSECRKFSGSGSSAFAGIHAADLTIVKDDGSSLAVYAKSKNTRMRFCSTCGSSLYAEKPLLGVIHLRLGSLDSPIPLRPQAHVHVASKAEWCPIDDVLPQFEAEPPAELAAQALDGITP